MIKIKERTSIFYKAFFYKKKKKRIPKVTDILSSSFQCSWQTFLWLSIGQDYQLFNLISLLTRFRKTRFMGRFNESSEQLWLM